MDIVIGLIGAKGAGKTTAFEVIKALVDAQEITLASKLKDASAKVFNIPRDHFDSHKFKENDLADPVFLTRDLVEEIFSEYGVSGESEGFYTAYIRQHIGKVLHTPRQVAQYVGTEILRTYREDIHCTSAVEGVIKSIGVVTDMRFPNEFEFFADQYPGFHPIYIENMRAEITAGKDTHASEAHLKTLAARAEYRVTNNDSIQLFQESIRKVLRSICE